MRVKTFSLIALMMLFFTSCSAQHVMKQTLSSNELTEQKNMTVTSQDSVKTLLYQARWGDGSAYLKLADCYRDGFGVKKDLLGMFVMVVMAEERRYINRVDDYIYGMPDGNDYKTLLLLLNSDKSFNKEDADSLEQALSKNGLPEAKAFLGMMTVKKGDAISGMNMLKEAAEQGCSMAELLLIMPDMRGVQRADITKLRNITDRVPLAYSLLGDLYYKPDENGKTDKKLAVEYYMKAEEHAILDQRGASRVLDYYRNGGDIQLTEDDVKRLELKVRP